MKGEAFIPYCGSGEAALLLRCAVEACFAAAVGAGCKIDKYARWVDGLVKVQNDPLTMDFTNKEAAGAIDFTARCFILQPENWSLFGSMCWPEFQTTAITIENRLVRNENRARRTDNAVHLEWAWLIERNPVSDDAPGEINSEARNADEGLPLAAGAIYDVQRYAIAALGAEPYIGLHAILDLVVAIILLGLYGLFLLYSLRTHPETFIELNAPPEVNEEQHSSLGRGIGTLLVASLGAAWMSELLVGAAEQAGRSLGMSQIFMGVIVLALVGGAAESGSAIAMGRANRPDLSIGIALGSCVQIALFVAPVLVLLAPVMGQPQFRLVFSQAEMWMLFGAVLLGATVTTTGQATWFRGTQLLALYLIITAILYLIPAVTP
jgi:hypothetical protein